MTPLFSTWVEEVSHRQKERCGSQQSHTDKRDEYRERDAKFFHGVTFQAGELDKREVKKNGLILSREKREGKSFKVV